jgi:hypothetical protein
MLILRFSDSRLRFLYALCHSICELIDGLQFQSGLMRLKTHVQVSTSVNHEGGLLRQSMHMVVVREFT